MNIVQAAADLVWSPVLRKFPDLKFALSEGGIGWIPYFLERVDYNYQRHHLWTGQDFGDRLPSEVFNEHVITCFIDDHFGVASRELPRHGQRVLGVRLPALRLDLADRARRRFLKQMDGSPGTTSTGSATRTPCATSTSTPSRSAQAEDCTVAALRRRAAGHDVSIRARGKRGGGGILASQLGHEMTDKGYRYVTYEALDEGTIVRIMFNRPKARNAQNRGMLVELDQAFRRAEADDQVRVVILGGAGPMFSAGHDMGSAESGPSWRRGPTSIPARSRTGAPGRAPSG